MPVLKLAPDVDFTTMLVMAAVERHKPTLLSTPPEPLLSALFVIKAVLFVEPAYENTSKVKNDGLVALPGVWLDPDKKV